MEPTKVKNIDITAAKMALKNCPKIVQDYTNSLEKVLDKQIELTNLALARLRTVGKTPIGKGAVTVPLMSTQETIRTIALRAFPEALRLLDSYIVEPNDPDTIKEIIDFLKEWEVSLD